MKEINTTYTKKQDLLRQQEQIYFNTKYKNPLMFVELSINMGISEGIRPLRAFFSVHDSGRSPPSVIKQMLFTFWSVLRIWGENDGN